MESIKGALFVSIAHTSALLEDGEYETSNVDKALFSVTCFVIYSAMQDSVQSSDLSHYNLTSLRSFENIRLG